MLPLLYLSVDQERLPEGNKDYVSSEWPQHHPTAVCVCVVRPAVHGYWVHGERRPQHVPVAAGDREHSNTCQQHPFSQVNHAHSSHRSYMKTIDRQVSKRSCQCTFDSHHFESLSASPLQPVWPPPYGGADLVGDEVLGISELCAPWPGHKKLPAGPPPHHQDRRLRYEPKPVQQRLLPYPGPGGAAYTMDGLGEHLAGKVWRKGVDLRYDLYFAPFKLYTSVMCYFLVEVLRLFCCCIKNLQILEWMLPW